MKKSVLLLLALWLCHLTLMATTVSQQRAKQIAAQFLSDKSTSHRSFSASQMQAAVVFDAVNGMGAPYLYAVQASSGDGYVIVSGDDRFAEVLGYSDSGSFDEKQMPDNMKAWLQGFIEEMKELDGKGYAPVKTSRRATEAWPAIKPMTMTKWHQREPYNEMLPTADVIGHYSAGCMTIATAQLVRYWAQKTGKPTTTLKAIPAYTTETAKIALEELPDTTFDWTKMRNAYDATSAEADKAEVANFIKYCAYANKSDFTPLVTGGRIIDIPKTLIEYFGFDNTANVQMHALHSQSDWAEMIYNELKNQRPVIYGASMTEITLAGHAFIIDGYDGDAMFHINFGWGGSSDGYYKLSVLDYHNKDNKDAPVSISSFTSSQMAVFEAQIGVSTPAEPLYSSLLWTFLVSENTVTAGYSNLFGVPNTLELGLAYLDESGTLEPIVTKEEEVPQEMSFKEIAYTVQPTDKPQGTYKIVPISRIKGSTLWTIERYRYVWATFDGTTVKLTPSAPQLEATDVQAIGSKRAKLDQEVSFVLTNKGSEFLDEIYLFASTTEEKGKVQSHCVVTVEENGSQQVVLIFKPDVAGKWNVWITTDEAGTNVIGSAAIDIAEFSNPVVKFTATNKPATVADLKAAIGTEPVASGDAVELNSLVTMTAAEAPNYHVDWYVNGKKANAVGYSFTQTMSNDYQIEARYVENFKFIFEGTPFVKYADANGIIYMGPNFYCHKFDKLRAFGYSVENFTGSNGKTYLVDNSPDSVLVVKDTLTADVVMTPNYVLNQCDLGDNTVAPVWDFDKPDSVARFDNYQGKCCFTKPTWFDSNYIDLNMTCDANNGWIDNVRGQQKGYADVGTGTKFTLPARYGTVYRVTTKGELSATTIADSISYKKSTDAAGNQVATLYYRGSDKDSIQIVVGEDIQLVSIAASYPGGDNTLTWLPDTTATTKDELVTVEKTGEAGGLLYDLSDLTLNGGLKVVAGEHRDSCSVQIEVPNEKDETKYLSATFRMDEGFSFALQRLLMQMVLEGADKSANVEIVLSDEFGTELKSKVYEHRQTDLVFTDTLENLGKPNNLHMEGKITLKVYVYGAADYYRLFMPITCGVEICEVMRFPEGYNYATYKAKSEIDNDGSALLSVDAFELVGVDDEHDYVILNPIEEIPMGDVLVIHSDEAGAVHHIPLTRADDAYVRGNNKLWVSDGTVKGGKDIYRFSKEGDQYVFRSSSADVTLPRGEIYMKFHSTTRKEVYYLSEKSVPEPTPELVFHETEDNKALIEQYKGRTVKKVVLDGHKLYKNHMWNTICLPFDIIGENIDASPLQGAEIHEMDLTNNGDYIAPTGYDAETGVVTLNFKSVHAIEPGKPYFLEWRTTTASEVVNPEFENVTIKTTPGVEMAMTSNDGKVQFLGTYAPVMLSGDNASNLYVGTDDRIHIPTEHNEVGAFSGYFLIDLGNGLGVPGSNPLNKILLNIAGGDDVLRVITIIVPQHLKDGVWYDLQGKKYVNLPTQRGIYILNGKKILIK